MQLRYYVAIDDKGERIIMQSNDMPGLLQFLRKKEEGILFYGQGDQVPTEFQFQINYNVRNGEVTLVNAKPLPGVTDIYTNESFQQLFTKPLSDAITLLAKQRLLEHLFLLKDDKVKTVILMFHAQDAKGGLLVNVLNVDSTLQKLRMRPVTLFGRGSVPSLQAQLDSLLGKEVLNSLESADRIRDQLTSSKPTPTTPRPS